MSTDFSTRAMIGCLARLRPFIRAHDGLVVRMTAFLFFVSALSMIPAVIGGRSIEALSRGDVKALAVLTVLSASLGLATAALGNLQARLSIELTNALSTTLRKSAFEAVQRASVAQLGERTLGELINRVESDVDGLVSAVMNLLPVLTALVTCMWLLIAMPLTDWRLTLIGLPFIPLWLLTFAPLGRRVAAIGERLAAARDVFVTALSESLSVGGLIRVKTFVRHDADREMLMRRYAHFLELKLAQYRAGRSTAVWQNVLMSIASGTVFLAGCVLMSRHTIGLATVITFAGFFGRVLGPIGQLAATGAHGMTINFNSRRLFELLELPQERRVGCTAVNGCAVSVQDVSFSYPGTPVLEGINFDVPPGGQLVIEGPSGCGKSTLMRLMVGLLDTDGGCITVGGSDIRTIALDPLRRYVGFVPQDGQLFTGTLRENLVYGNPSASDRAVWSALALVRLSDWVAQLDAGLETAVSAQAVNLSGGQRQRLVLARALIAEPRVLLLDEATSAVDPATEEEIYSALISTYADVTMIIVAHRRSAALAAVPTMNLRPYASAPAIAFAS